MIITAICSRTYTSSTGVYRQGLTPRAKIKNFGQKNEWKMLNVIIRCVSIAYRLFSFNVCCVSSIPLLQFPAVEVWPDLRPEVPPGRSLRFERGVDRQVRSSVRSTPIHIYIHRIIHTPTIPTPTCRGTDLDITADLVSRAFMLFYVVGYTTLEIRFIRSLCHFSYILWYSDWLHDIGTDSYTFWRTSFNCDRIF